jgi:hypothetical protein
MKIANEMNVIGEFIEVLEKKKLSATNNRSKEQHTGKNPTLFKDNITQAAILISGLLKHSFTPTHKNLR